MKPSTAYLRCIGTVVSIVTLMVITMPMEGVAHASTTTRPISDFVNAQVSAPEGLDWSDPFTTRQLVVDLFGLDNTRLMRQSGGAVNVGTTMSGTVTVRPLADGRAEVEVELRTHSALTWVTLCPSLSTLTFCDPFAPPVLFGHQDAALLAGAAPGLGENLFHAKFIITSPDAPLPDFQQIAFAAKPGQMVESVGDALQADGPLGQAFGVPDGTPGTAQMTQVGLVSSTADGVTKCTPPAILKCGFPAQHIDLKATGR